MGARSRGTLYHVAPGDQGGNPVLGAPAYTTTPAHSDNPFAGNPVVVLQPLHKMERRALRDHGLDAQEALGRLPFRFLPEGVWSVVVDRFDEGRLTRR
jgi:hypothetical protein